MKILSYNGINSIMDNVIALWSVAGGILKFEPMFLFIVMPCFVKNVAGCWKITANMRSIVHIGNSLIITFTFGSRHMLIFESLFMTLMLSQFSRQSGLS